MSQRYVETWNSAGSFLFGGAGAVSFSLVMDNQESVSFFPLKEKIS